MIRVNRDSLEEISQDIKNTADLEILALKTSKEDRGEEITEEEKTAINMKYANKQINTIAQIMLLSPERLFKTGLGINTTSDGWREGYTKTTIARRRETNRRRNKAARNARKVQRKG